MDTFGLHWHFLTLQDSPTENAYLAAIKAHFCYWSSYDTALFILRAVYGVDVLQESRHASKTKPLKNAIAEKASMSDAQDARVPAVK